MSERLGLAIDLGGTKIAGAIFDENGKVSPQHVMYVNDLKGKAVGKLITHLIQHFLDWADVNKKHITDIGVAVPGIYYSKTGKVWAPNIPDWEAYDLLSEIKEYVSAKNISVKIDSDRACYILGECWYGATKGCENAIFLAVGTGIGAGILIDGKVLRGAHDIAGAIGWLALIDPFQDGYETYGCFEYHASGGGMARMATQLLKQKETNFVSSQDVPIDKITAHHVFEAYRQGDSNAITIVNRSVEFWAKATANLVSLFNPEKIIFGGGVFGPAIEKIDDIYLEAKRWAQPISIGLVEFVASELGNEAGLYGAGYLAVKG